MKNAIQVIAGIVKDHEICASIILFLIFTAALEAQSELLLKLFIK